MLRHERGGTERHAPRRLAERFEFQNRIVVMPVAVTYHQNDRLSPSPQRGHGFGRMPFHPAEVDGRG